MDQNHELWIKSFKVDFEAIKKLIEETPETKITDFIGKIDYFNISGSIDKNDLEMKIMVTILDVDEDENKSVTDNIRPFSNSEWLAAISYEKIKQLCSVAGVKLKGTTPEILRDLLQYRQVCVKLRKSEKGIFIKEYRSV